MGHFAFKGIWFGLKCLLGFTKLNISGSINVYPIEQTRKLKPNRETKEIGS